MQELQSICNSSNPVINYNLEDELPKKIKYAKKAAQITSSSSSYNKTYGSPMCPSTNHNVNEPQPLRANIFSQGHKAQ